MYFTALTLKCRHNPDPNRFGRIWIRSNRPDPDLTKKFHKMKNKFYKLNRYFGKKMSSFKI